VAQPGCSSRLCPTCSISDALWGSLLVLLPVLGGGNAPPGWQCPSCCGEGAHMWVVCNDCSAVTNTIILCRNPRPCTKRVGWSKQNLSTWLPQAQLQVSCLPHSTHSVKAAIPVVHHSTPAAGLTVRERLRHSMLSIAVTASQAPARPCASAWTDNLSTFLACWW